MGIAGCPGLCPPACWRCAAPQPHWAAAQTPSTQAGSSWGPALSGRTLLGFALAGGRYHFIKTGFDYHREADPLYDRYLDALDQAEISLLYERTNKRDLKSKLSWALGGVMAVGGIHLAFGRQLAALHLHLAGRNLGARVELNRPF
ncbi:MAG: hypothetical protein FJY95_02080 [Candidatus Handelsmanbacteria bacterium]|nr:hypothetical protein [Candidatus Handelsmanbacteria bacterium]